MAKARMLFDGRRIGATINQDSVLFCGYHPNQGGRCGRATTSILVTDADRGNAWFPICDRCWNIAWTGHFNGEGIRHVKRFME